MEFPAIPDPDVVDQNADIYVVDLGHDILKEVWLERLGKISHYHAGADRWAGFLDVFSYGLHFLLVPGNQHDVEPLLRTVVAELLSKP